MRRVPITKSERAAFSDRSYDFPGDPTRYRDDSGSIDPFWDGRADEAEWEKVDLGGFPRGFDLVGVCLRIVWKDKEILAYQGASLALCVLFLIAFMAAITHDFDSEYIEQNVNPVAVIFQLFPYAVLAGFIGTFFSAATIAVATIRMKGGNPVFSDGLEVAAKKSHLILVWAIISAIVATVLALIRSRSRGGRIAADVGQLAWSVATYFVVPVMLFEKRDPISAIDRSTSIVRRTWRESLAGNLGMGFTFFMLLIIGLLLFVPVGNALAGMVGAVTVAIIWVIFVLILSSAANAVLVAALYWLARTGRMPATMDGYGYDNLGTALGGVDRSSAEDVFLTADELTRKYAR